jgi:hypothetical protein
MIGVLLATALLAQPTYLECAVTRKLGNHERHLQITLNEATGKAHYRVVEDNGSDTMDAMFTPSEVSWTRDMGGAWQHTKIDRSSLEYISETDGFPDFEETGQCVIPKTAVKRKF